jgi:hypothetical protein
LLLNLIPAIDPVEEGVLKTQIRNSSRDIDTANGERAFREAITGLIQQSKIFVPKTGYYQRVESPEVLDAIKKAIQYTQTKLDEFRQLQKFRPGESE